MKAQLLSTPGTNDEGHWCLTVKPLCWSSPAISHQEHARAYAPFRSHMIKREASSCYCYPIIRKTAFNFVHRLLSFLLFLLLIFHELLDSGVLFLYISWTSCQKLSNDSTLVNIQNWQLGMILANIAVQYFMKNHLLKKHNFIQ